MLVFVLLYQSGLLKAVCKLVSENSFRNSATNLIMVTLGNESMRSWVVDLSLSIKGQVQLIFNPLTAAAASSYLVYLQLHVCLPRRRQEFRDWAPARPGFASGLFLGKRGRSVSAASLL